MDTASATSPHREKRPSCNGQCTGHGTCSNCPPLIVVAMMLAQQITVQGKSCA
jgi:hypothetical protein